MVSLTGATPPAAYLAAVARMQGAACAAGPGGPLPRGQLPPAKVEQGCAVLRATPLAEHDPAAAARCRRAWPRNLKFLTGRVRPG